MRLRLFRALALSALSALPGGVFSYSVTDGSGRRFEFSSPPSRVATLTPSITEEIYAIGAEDSLVGTSRYCSYPPGAEKKPKIGGFADPDYEKIARIKPEIVVLPMLADRGIEDKLKILGIRCFYLNKEGLENIASDVRLLGELFQKRAGAESVARNIDILVRRRNENMKIPPSKKPRAIFLFGRMAAGKNSYIGDVLEVCGFRNCADASGRPWCVPTGESVLRTDPEIVFAAVADRAEADAVKNALSSDPVWSATSALKNSRVVCLDRGPFIIPAPRITEAVEILDKHAKSLRR